VARGPTGVTLLSSRPFPFLRLLATANNSPCDRLRCLLRLQPRRPLRRLVLGLLLTEAAAAAPAPPWASAPLSLQQAASVTVSCTLLLIPLVAHTTKASVRRLARC